MELAYEKLLKEHGLTVNDLNEDAQSGVKTIKQIMQAVTRLGKTLSKDSLQKVKSNDKWVCQEILEQVDGRERNEEDEVPHSAEEVIAEVKAEEQTPSPTKPEEQESSNENEEQDQPEKEVVLLTPEQKHLLALDLELKALHEDKAEWEITEVKSKAPNVYKLIFEGYEDEGENGVLTSRYKLIETKTKKVFAVSKK